MKAFETTISVGEDRRLTEPLPVEVPAGRHRVILLLEEGDTPAVNWRVADFALVGAGDAGVQGRVSEEHDRVLGEHRW